MNCRSNKPTLQLSVRHAFAHIKTIARSLGRSARQRVLQRGHRRSPSNNSDNANSIVLLNWAAFRFYDGGDLTWNIEKQLVCPGNLVGKVDVYQSTHHGLDASNNPVLVKTLAPTVAVINNGVTKGCEPYTFTTLKGLSSLQALCQVHRNERADSHHNTEAAYIANSEKDAAATAIPSSCRSIPPARAYTVAVPSTKHERTFQTK